MRLSLQNSILASAYASDIGEEATYTSATYGASAVRVVRESSNATQLSASLLGLRGIVVSFRALIAEIPNRPVNGDTIETADATYTVDQAEDIDEAEWRIYARA